VLLTNRIRDAVFAGDVDVAFRRWRKPTVKAGGRLRTALGEVNIVDVAVVDPALITDEDARRAGLSSADAVRHELFRERTGSVRGRTASPTSESLVYRILMAPGGSDPRVLLRSSNELSSTDFDDIVAKLNRMDSPRGGGRVNWTTATLALIEAWPGRRAPELAELEGLETLVFKASVRRLKEMGLTESLSVGYRLSPRGEAVLGELRRRAIAEGSQSL
jgi:hypothetical protein